MEKVFLNNKLVDIDKASLAITESGFLYGAGLFETMRSYEGVVFAMDDHLDRLFFSANKLSINNNYDKKFIAEAIYKTLKANELTDARLRLTLTSGPMAMPDESREATLLITAIQIQLYPAQYYENGAMVVLCPYRQNPTDPTCGHKTLSYFPRMMGLNFARSRMAAEALWFTVDNRLAEGCISNVFLVKDSVLSTPTLTTGILAGVARKTVCQIAVDNSVELVEKDLYIDDVLAADEIFMTNVIMQIMPITRVEKHTVGDGKVGPTTKKVHEYFNKFIESYCKQSK